jgi:hypothetical protein
MITLKIIVDHKICFREWVHNENIFEIFSLLYNEIKQLSINSQVINFEKISSHILH